MADADYTAEKDRWLRAFTGLDPAAYRQAPAGGQAAPGTAAPPPAPRDNNYFAREDAPWIEPLRSQQWRSQNAAS